MENGRGRVGCIIWRFKNRPHIYIFDEKFLWIRDSFCIMIFGIFSMFYMRIMQSENFATDIHTHYRQSETAPLYTRIICEKNFAQIYMRIAVRLESVGDWLGVGIFAFVCIIFCICGHRLDRVVFVDWSLSKFAYKSVIGLHKFIVKNVIL